MKTKATLNAAKKHLLQCDPVLERIITSLPSLASPNAPSVFHDLMSCIIEQQIHYRSTKKIFEKMLTKANVSILTPENFSEFERKAFEGVKLSVKKYEAIEDLLRQETLHELNWQELPDEEVRVQLAPLKGIGNWTIDMILIYTLGRADVFSYDDFHIKQIMTSLYNLNPKSKLKAQMKAIAENWSPYKSIAFRYLIAWKKYNQSKNK